MRMRFSTSAAGLALCLLALGGCGISLPASSSVAPSAAADATTLDEKSAIAAESAYTAASLAGAKLVQAGAIDKAKFKALDAEGYTAVLATRDAYAAGNAADFASALAHLTAVTADIKALTTGSN